MPDTPPTPLALFLAEHDVPCPNPKCNFNLRGLKDTTCPECKEPLNLAVRRPEALWYMRNWVVSATVLVVVGACMIAWAWAEYWNLERFGFAGKPPQFVFACAEVAVALGLGVSLVRYFTDSRRNDLQSLPRLLWSFLVATVLQAVAISTAAGVTLFG